MTTPDLTDEQVDAISTKAVEGYRAPPRGTPFDINTIYRLIARAAYAAGAASVPSGEPVACPRCKGTGRIEVTSFADPGKLIENNCRVCKGTGEIAATGVTK